MQHSTCDSFIRKKQDQIPCPQKSLPLWAHVCLHNVPETLKDPACCLNENIQNPNKCAVSQAVATTQPLWPTGMRARHYLVSMFVSTLGEHVSLWEIKTTNTRREVKTYIRPEIKTSGILSNLDVAITSVSWSQKGSKTSMALTVLMLYISEVDMKVETVGYSIRQQQTPTALLW